MSDQLNVVLFLANCIICNNFIFSQHIGICPFLGVSNKIETALSMGIAVTFVMTLASLFSYLANLVLIALGIEYMQTISFILLIAGLVQLVEMFIKKTSPSLYGALGVYLPLITTNCAVLGVAIINVNNGYNLIYSVLNGMGGALGFTLAIVLLAGVRERLESSNIPEALKGFPISLVSAGLMSMAFLGFAGLIK